MKSTGQLGELMAVNYLRTQDFLILQQNFRTPFGELDIIAKKDASIHIVEVKYQTPPIINSAYKLNKKKRRRMIRSTQIFMDQFKLSHYFYQFDLIEIVKETIQHKKNIFNLNDV